MGGRTVTSSVKPLGVLALIESEYQIDRQLLKTELLAAHKEQQELDEFMDRSAAKVKNWSDLARKLAYRQRTTREAIDRLIGELKKSVFDEVARGFIAARLGYLKHQLDASLGTREELATVLASLARWGVPRGRGQSRQSILNECFQKLVDQLMDSERPSGHVPKEKALQYVGTLAHINGVISAENAPGAAVRRRLSGHRAPVIWKGLLSTVTALVSRIALADFPARDTPTNDALRIAEQIARDGRWPDQLMIKTSRPPQDEDGSSRVRRRAIRDAEDEDFFRLEQALIDRAQSENPSK